MTNNESLMYNLGLNIHLKTLEQQCLNITNLTSFIRGIFDTHGEIVKKTIIEQNLICMLNIKFPINKILLDFIKGFNNIEHTFETNSNIITMTYINSNALDFLSKIYDNSDARYRNSDNYNTYIKYIGFNNVIPTCKFFKTSKDAILPSKDRASDSGYDLTAINISKKIGSKTVMLDTGIIVEAPFGYYTEIIPRSSIVKSGYILSNSIGIIDNGFKGSLKICLTKIDDNLPDLTLPFKCCQLIIRRHIHYLYEEGLSLDEIKETTRGNGEFGSTDKATS